MARAVGTFGQGTMTSRLAVHDVGLSIMLGISLTSLLFYDYIPRSVWPFAWPPLSTNEDDLLRFSPVEHPPGNLLFRLHKATCQNKRLEIFLYPFRSEKIQALVQRLSGPFP